MATGRQRWVTHVRRWPFSLTAALAIAVVIAAVAVPRIYTARQIDALGSDNAERRAGAYLWLSEHRRDDAWTRQRVFASLRSMTPGQAWRSYLAFRNLYPDLHGDEFAEPLIEAYQNADAATYASLLRRLNRDGFRSARFFQETRHRLEQAEIPEHFEVLVAAAQDVSYWRPNRIPAEVWLRWINRLVASDLPEMRRRAVQALLDGYSAPNHDRSWDALTLTQQTHVLTLIETLADDTDAAVGHGAAFARVAWHASGLLEPSVLTIRRHAALGPASGSSRFNSVIPQGVDGTSPPVSPEPMVLHRLESLYVEHLDGDQADYNLEAPTDIPPLQRIFQAGLPTNHDRITMFELLLSENSPWLRSLATVVAAQNLSVKDSSELIERLSSRIDPIERQSAILLAAAAEAVEKPDHGTPRLGTGLGMGVGYRANALNADSQGETDPDPVVRALWSITNDKGTADDYRGMLQREGLPYPVVLSALLVGKERAGWDHVLGPFGLSDDELLTLLDHYRFAWVLDALMPADAPRFPLWVDRETQLEAIAALRAWYARHRATWTHG